jgi:hypothetical protein
MQGGSHPVPPPPHRVDSTSHREQLLLPDAPVVLLRKVPQEEAVATPMAHGRSERVGGREGEGRGVTEGWFV